VSGFLGGGIGPMALKRRRAAAADWWQVAGQTCVAAYKAIGAASLAASYVNLANPGTYNAAPGVAPTLAAGGWSFGAGQYLTTGVAPQAGFSIAVRFLAGAADGAIFGVNDANFGWFCQLDSSANRNLYTIGTGTYLITNPAQIAGVVAVANNFAYRDGILDGTIPSGGSIPAYALFLGARNYNGSPIGIRGNQSIAAVAIYSTTLSAADVAALTTRMQALA